MGYNTWSFWRPQPGFLREQRWEGWWLDGGEQGALPEKKIGWYSGLLGGLAPSFSLRMLGGGEEIHPTAWASQWQAAGGISPISLGSSTWGAQLGSALWGRGEREGT